MSGCELNFPHGDWQHDLIPISLSTVPHLIIPGCGRRRRRHGVPGALST
jgi:hypothetical protein